MEAPRVHRIELLEHAVEYANDGIAIMDITGDPIVPVRIVYANPTIERFTGYTNAELLDPSNPLLIVQTENRPMFERLFGEILAGRPVRFDLKLGGKNRSTWVEASWSPLRGADGSITHYVAVLRDLSKWRVANADRNTLYRAIEEIADFVVLCDSTLPSQGGPFVTFANVSFRHALDYNGCRLAGQSFTQLLSPENDALALDHVTRMFESSHLIEKELLIARSDETSFWVELSAHPIDIEDASAHWFVVARDISARKLSLEQSSLQARGADALPWTVEVKTLDQARATLVDEGNAENGGLSAPADILQRAIAGERAETETVRLIPLTNHLGEVDAIVYVSLVNSPTR